MGIKFITKTALVVAIYIAGSQLKAQEVNIQFNELPQTAQTFVNENFTGLKIFKTTKETGRSEGTDYEVYFEDRTKVEFDSKGNWKEVDGNNSQIPTAYLPASISKYVAENFPSRKISKVEKSSSRFEVELDNDIDLKFSSEGKFLKMDD